MKTLLLTPGDLRQPAEPLPPWHSMRARSRSLRLAWSTWAGTSTQPVAPHADEQPGQVHTLLADGTFFIL